MSSCTSSLVNGLLLSFFAQAVNLRANQFTRFPTQLKVARHTAQELHLVCVCCSHSPPHACMCLHIHVAGHHMGGTLLAAVRVSSRPCRSPCAHC